ncbi:unnamed protein product [Rhizoctonia solani]|uniref:Inhibitor I9 domain-containing protein n=1 Tax=Rhizoctonia solani TaxID=456999 RepID=A0A8H2ZX75_9AGAM|nr:unnamed protein product [Rhizoctonia solani]
MSEATKPVSTTPMVDLAHEHNQSSERRKLVDPAPERAAFTTSNGPSTPATIARPIKNSYFIELTGAANLNEHLKWMENQSEKYSNTEYLCKVVRRYDFGLKAYLANLSGPALNDVKNHPDVKLVGQDAEGTLFGWQAHLDRVPLEGQLNVKTGLSPHTPLV